MAKNYKERTVPQPHKVVREMSLFLGKFEAQPNNEGWVFRKELQHEEGYLEVATRRKVTAHDGKIFDFVMSNLFAQRNYVFKNEKGKLKDLQEVDLRDAYAEVTIDISEVLKFRGLTQDRKNKLSIINSLKNMVGMTVEISKGEASLIYSVLTRVEVDKVNKNIVYVKVNEEINQAFYRAGMRFINIERALPLKSDVAVEFTKFIQVRSNGGIILGEPMTVSEFTHDDAVFFLHLEHLEEKLQMQEIRRAIKATYDQGFEKYKMKRTSRGIFWDKVPEDINELRSRQIAIAKKRKT